MLIFRRIKTFSCPVCGPSLLLKLKAEETAIRCIRCRATAIHLSIISVINKVVENRGRKSVYELSSRGALLAYLKANFISVQTSEYFDDIPAGSSHRGIRCEDIQSLSFADQSFDLVSSTEVFEHVPDDLAGFREVFRVLKDGGYFIFTVPMSDQPQTIERAVYREDGIEYLLPAEFHGDKIRSQVLVYRDYGSDITRRLLQAGFSQAKIIRPEVSWFGYSRLVLVARK